MEIDDITYEVFNHLTPESYKICRIVCRKWNKILRPQLRYMIENHCALITTILHLYPDGINLRRSDINERRWLGMDIPNSTLKLLEDVIEPWNYDLLSKNSHVNWNTILDCGEDKWNYERLSFNSNITWDIVQQHPDKQWSYEWMSYNPNINMDIVMENPHDDWNTYHLSLSTTWDMVEKYPHCIGLGWDHLGLSYNSNITPEIVQNHPEIRWNHQGLVSNANFSWEMVQELAGDNLWNYIPEIFYNPNVPWECIRDNANGLYFHHWMGMSPNITWKTVQQHPEKNWGYDYLSVNPNITWENVKQSIESEMVNDKDGWNLYKLMNRKDILVDIIMDALEE